MVSLESPGVPKKREGYYAVSEARTCQELIQSSGFDHIEDVLVALILCLYFQEEKIVLLASNFEYLFLCDSRFKSVLSEVMDILR